MKMAAASDSDSDSDAKPAVKKAAPLKMAADSDSDSDSDSSSSSSDSESEDEAPKNKKAAAKTPARSATSDRIVGSANNTPFRRVADSEAEELHPLMRNNSYAAQKSIGAATLFGQNADNVLIKTQGKSFIKAKNKFKNNYRGGELDCVVRSHKFN